MGRISRAIAALVGAASWAEAQAADFPRRPVVPFAPGGRDIVVEPAPFTKLWMDTWRQLGRVIQQRHIAIG
jgi:hypothetical protein